MTSTAASLVPEDAGTAGLVAADHPARGQVMAWRGPPPTGDPPPRLVATVHPSSVIPLRGSDEQAYREVMADLVDDLRVVRGRLAD